MEEPLLVTSYESPDLDGTACAVAYGEFLNKHNTPASVGIFGTLHRETQFVLQTFTIPHPPSAESMIKINTKIVLVDASEIMGISDSINPNHVVELIDHRLVNEADKFPHAKTQIELVGSAATLIAEKFHKDNTPISPESAALLYSAIVSNTINFQATVTTQRDKDMAQWLSGKVTIPPTYIHDMFAHKSQITGSLKEIIEHDFAVFEFNGKCLGVAQLEMVDVPQFISSRKKEIQSILEEMKTEKNLDYVFMTTIDAMNATNTFVVIDEETKAVVEEGLHVIFQNDVAVRPGVLMRKSIIPLLKVIIETS